MTKFTKVNIAQLEFISFNDPVVLSAVRRRFVRELYRLKKLGDLLNSTKVLRHRKKLYAFENFFLLKAVLLEHPQYTFDALVIDEKRQDHCIDRIVNQAVANSAGAQELSMLPAFDKSVEHNFSEYEMGKFLERIKWAEIFSCDRTKFNYHDPLYVSPPKQSTVADTDEARSKIDSCILSSIPDRKR